MANEKILIVDDDESIRKVLGFILDEAGYSVRRAGSAIAAMDMITDDRPDLVLSDVKMPEVDGITLLKQIMKLDSSLPVVMLTAFGSIETAVEAIKLGAADYIAKPISRDELKLAVEKTLRFKRLEAENTNLRESLRDKFRFENIVGHSPSMQKVFDVVSKVAETEAAVLITGESGTGKELIAKAIHHNSSRRSARLVAVNCAAIPSGLLESELFGHVKGAFTGAVRDKEGKFELAQNGTLFLDEVSSLSLTLQAKLLRALQEKEVQKVGAEDALVVDTRIIAATNRPLPELIRLGEFREDLFYRLNVVPVRLPPLRERMSDIGPLVDHFAKKYSGDRDIHVSPEAVEVLHTYEWPGNVRELENFCERVIVMTRGDRIEETDVREQLDLIERDHGVPATVGVTLPEIEKQAIIDALRKCDGNQSRAARLLGIPRHVLLYRIKKFQIRRSSRRTSP